MKSIGRILLATLIALLAGTGAMARQQSPVIDERSVVISIPTEGEVYVGRELSATNKVADRVRELFRNRPPAEQVVYIKASRGISYGYVVSIINNLREAGIEQIGLVAEKDKDTPRAADYVTDARDQKPADEQTALPDQRKAQSEVGSEPLLVVKVSLTTNGQLRVRIGARLVRLVNLEAAMRDLLAGRQDKTVYLLAPQRARYGDIVGIVDALKGAGASPIGLQLDYLQ